MGISISQYAISMTIYIVVLLLMVEGMRRYRRFAWIFWILSLFTFPLWPAQLHGWFRWAKTLSVLIPTALFVGFGRIANFEDRKGKWEVFKKDWLLWALYGVLFLNIAEATLKDFATANYANGIVGVILCLTIPLVKAKGQIQKKWQFSKEKPGDLLAFTSPMWNFVYTTWNLAFVFGENAGFFASSFCILIAAELYPIIKKRPELYVTARVYTLAFHILIRSTYDIFTPIMDSSAWANQTVLSYWGIINLIIAIPFLIFWSREVINRRRAVNLTK
jgi:hypothetical protein